MRVHLDWTVGNHLQSTTSTKGIVLQKSFRQPCEVNNYGTDLTCLKVPVFDMFNEELSEKDNYLRPSIS
jgi:hypothetical protein